MPARRGAWGSTRSSCAAMARASWRATVPDSGHCRSSTRREASAIWTPTWSVSTASCRWSTIGSWQCAPARRHRPRSSFSTWQHRNVPDVWWLRVGPLRGATWWWQRPRRSRSNTTASCSTPAGTQRGRVACCAGSTAGRPISGRSTFARVSPSGAVAGGMCSWSTLGVPPATAGTTSRRSTVHGDDSTSTTPPRSSVTPSRRVGPRRQSTVVIGGSSGGLTVLGLLADHGELVAGAVASYPVSDLAGLAEATHRFEAHYTDTLVGRPGEPGLDGPVPRTVADQPGRPDRVARAGVPRRRRPGRSGGPQRDAGGSDPQRWR